MPALVERLRGLFPAQLTAVIDLAERLPTATLGSDFDGQARVREQLGIGGSRPRTAAASGTWCGQWGRPE